MSFAFGSGTGSSFGAAQPSASPGFSFGQTPGAANTSQAAGGSTGFSFGAPASTPAASTFSFGPSTSSSSSSFGLGGAAPATSTPSSAFSFGQNAGSSSFGSTAASSPFSFATGTGTPATSSFSFPSTGSGVSQPQGLGASTLFGTSSSTNAQTANAGGLFGSVQPPNSFSSNALAPTTESPLENLVAIKMAYQDPQQSRFKHMFYNIVDPSQVGLYTRPSHISERLWKQAEADNPDPENCVPAAVIGFQQLQERSEAQQQFILKFKKYVEDMRTSLRRLENSCRGADVKLEKCRVDHVQLSHKLLEVMRKIEVYQCLRKPMDMEETRLRNNLERLHALLNQPNQYKARLQELVSLQRMQDERYQNMEDKISEEDADSLRQVLDTQREGLKQLTKIVQKDIRDMEIIKKGVHQRVRTSK